MNIALLDKVFSQEDKIGVAVSGGQDSVCLLFMCIQYAKKRGKQVVCFHVNHGLRAESEEECKFVDNLCQTWNAKFVYQKVDVASAKKEDKTTLEETARKLRYKAIEKMAKQNGVNFVCLAHHMADQAETLLLHLLRGSGIKGACAMSELSGMYVRPLLHMTKREIEQYEQKHKLLHMEDASNLSTEFSRNFLRHEVLPKLEELQKGATEHLCAFASKMQQANELIESLAKKPKLVCGEVEIENDSNNLLFSHQVHNACILLEVMQDIEEKHITKIKELFDLETGSQIHLPHGLVAWKDAKGVVLCKKNKQNTNKSFEFSLGSFEFGEIKVKVEKVTKPQFGDGIIFVDMDKLQKNTILRHPQPNDKFQKLGSKGSKALCDYFTDKKIPQRKRGNVVVLAHENVIYAVVGFDVSERAKLDEGSKHIAKITREEK